MKSIVLIKKSKSIFLAALLLGAPNYTNAQIINSNTPPKQQVNQPPPTQQPPQPQYNPIDMPPPEYYAAPLPTEENQIITAELNTYRIFATYDYKSVGPVALNDSRKAFLWNNTTATQGVLDALNGFSVGAGYFLDIGALGKGYLGVEYASASQELTNTAISGGSTSVQDSFNYDTVMVMFDWVFHHKKNTFEIGIGGGQAIKYQYHNVLTSGSTQEDVLWEDTPLTFKVRGSYNYHFTDNFLIRAGGSYEHVTSSNLKSDANHPTVTINGSPVSSGQTLKNSSGQDQTVDMSGFHFNAGLVVAF